MCAVARSMHKLSAVNRACMLQDSSCNMPWATCGSKVPMGLQQGFVRMQRLLSSSLKRKECCGWNTAWLGMET